MPMRQEEEEGEEEKTILEKEIGVFEGKEEHTKGKPFACGSRHCILQDWVGKLGKLWSDWSRDV